jgi:sugar O-acyltransferase (sialic acid O-acetyltransferase NeuD family)
MTPLILVGGGGHCRSCIDVIESTKYHEIVGIVAQIGAEEGPVLGYPILGTDDDLDGLLRKCPTALITVGQIKTPELRKRLFQFVQDLGGTFPVVTSPHAYVSGRAKVGAGTIVMHGATINVGASVGVNCIVNSHALVEHDVNIGSHTHISTGARVNGGVFIGEGTFLGSGAIVNQGLSIGDKCIIGSGAVIRSDVPVGTQVTGEWQ